MGPVTRVVQTGIGLVAEIKAAKAEHKAAGASTKNDPNGSSSREVPSEQDSARLEHLQIDEKHDYEVEEDSALDEQFGGGAPPLYESQLEDSHDPLTIDGGSPPPYPTQELVSTSEKEFLQPSASVILKRLKYPVIIPQRRPGSKIRGFVRAYAPVLADHDIDQETFLGFLKLFHTSSQVRGP